MLLRLIGWAGILVSCASGRVVEDSVQSLLGPEPAGFELSPGLVVDRGRPAVYSMRSGGGIEAIDPATGRLFWSTEEASKPLWSDPELLLAQVEPENANDGLRLLTLNPLDGSVMGGEIELDLPSGVLPLIDEHLGTSFSVRAESRGETVLLLWSYLERPITGVSPPPGAPPQISRLEGAARLHLNVGRAEPIEASEAEEALRRRLPPALEAVIAAEGLQGPLWRGGSVAAATTRERLEGGESRVVLHRWREADGEALPEVELLHGRPVAELASGDKRHLLIADRVEPGAWKSYRWSIYSLATGETVGRVRSHRSAARFALLGEILIHVSEPFGRRVEGEWRESPRSLRAVDLRSGEPLWSRPLRDTSFRGPLPPAAPSAKPHS